MTENHDNTFYSGDNPSPLEGRWAGQVGRHHDWQHPIVSRSCLVPKDQERMEMIKRTPVFNKGPDTNKDTDTVFDRSCDSLFIISKIKSNYNGESSGDNWRE